MENEEMIFSTKTKRALKSVPETNSKAKGNNSGCHLEHVRKARLFICSGILLISNPVITSFMDTCCWIN